MIQKLYTFTATFRHFPFGKKIQNSIGADNGLEKKSGQASWEQLLDKLTVKDALPISKEQKERIPFPLLYQLLSTHMDGGSPHLDRESILEEEHRLRDVMCQMTHQSNELLDLLPSLNADHIFTTNYSYCIEHAFFLSADFSKAHIRKYRRFRLKMSNSKQPNHENYYRLHTGYIAKSTKRTPESGISMVNVLCQGALFYHMTAMDVCCSVLRKFAAARILPLWPQSQPPPSESSPPGQSYFYMVMYTF